MRNYFFLQNFYRITKTFKNIKKLKLKFYKIKKLL